MNIRAVFRDARYAISTIARNVSYEIDWNSFVATGGRWELAVQEHISHFHFLFIILCQIIGVDIYGIFESLLWDFFSMQFVFYPLESMMVVGQWKSDLQFILSVNIATGCCSASGL